MILSQSSNRTRCGFTLVELLVVISIISILLRLLLPALSKAREGARASACMANLHSLGMGMAMYDSEYGGVPRANNEGNDPTLGVAADGDWLKHLAPYIRGEDQATYLAENRYSKEALYVCPSVTLPRIGTAVVHVGMNSYMDTGRAPTYTAPESSVPPWGLSPNPMTGKPSNSVIPLEWVQRPTEIFLLGDKALTSSSWMPIISPDVTGTHMPDLRHNDTAQIVLVDGHCARFSLDEVLEQAKHYLWWR